MWATMVNEASGMRLVGQSLTMHSVDKSKTPFFDTLTTNSFGYGGEPVDATTRYQICTPGRKTGVHAFDARHRDVG